MLVDASLVQHWESLIREFAEQARQGKDAGANRGTSGIKNASVCMVLVTVALPSYYELPDGSAELQDLISYKNMNSADR